MKLSTAWTGFLFHMRSRDLSEHTVSDYQNSITKFIEYIGDRHIKDITKQDVAGFITSLNGRSKKTKLNYHIGLAAMWTWLLDEGLATSHIVRAVKPPRPSDPEIVPFTEQDIQLLLANLDRTVPYKRNFQYEPSTHAVPNGLRNKTIIYLLLDTGIRASELCNLELRDLDMRNKELRIRSGKGDKNRPVYFSAKTGKLLWRYLAGRPHATDDHPIIAADDEALRPRGLGLMLERLGRKAGVRNVYPHRFRHTFAINYLRNGGDPFTLQKLLGHSDMAMTRRYINLAKEDLSKRHHAASPVANWNI